MAIELLKSTPARIEALNWVINNRPPINLNPPPVQSKKQELLSSYSTAQQTQYNGMFKIIPIEQTETTMKIAVADGATWNPETQTSDALYVRTSAQVFYLNSVIFEIEKDEDYYVFLEYGDGLPIPIIVCEKATPSVKHVLIGKVKETTINQIYISGPMVLGYEPYSGYFSIRDISERDETGEATCYKIQVRGGATDIGDVNNKEFTLSPEEWWDNEMRLYLVAKYTEGYVLDIVWQWNLNDWSAYFPIGLVCIVNGYVQITQEWTRNYVYFREHYFI